jgi:hypothetical protein
MLAGKDWKDFQSCLICKMLGKGPSLNLRLVPSSSAAGQIALGFILAHYTLETRAARPRSTLHVWMSSSHIVESRNGAPANDRLSSGRRMDIGNLLHHITKIK